MGTVAQIMERLRRHPDLKYREATGTVTVEPATADGFPVTLSEGADEWVVSFAGWHEHFTSEEEAINCFVFGLSDRCRLRVNYRGSLPHRWTVEERMTPSPNPEPVLVRDSLCPGWGWKGFSDEEATQCRADRGLASAG